MDMDTNKTTAMFFEIDNHREFKKWLGMVIGQDGRFEHLLEHGYEEERAYFYDHYFLRGLSPWKTLQKEYHKFG